MDKEKFLGEVRLTEEEIKEVCRVNLVLLDDPENAVMLLFKVAEAQLQKILNHPNIAMMTDESKELAQEIVEATCQGNVSSKDLAAWLIRVGYRRIIPKG